jgi:hypothetical protein
MARLPTALIAILLLAVACEGRVARDPMQEEWDYIVVGASCLPRPIPKLLVADDDYDSHTNLTRQLLNIVLALADRLCIGGWHFAARDPMQRISLTTFWHCDRIWAGRLNGGSCACSR